MPYSNTGQRETASSTIAIVYRVLRNTLTLAKLQSPTALGLASPTHADLELDAPRLHETRSNLDGL